jgi:3,8-divinyl chlorophyllide a/chlorophyllide a reductase subunit Y
MQEVRPDLALGTTPLVQKAKEGGVPAIYFTNMVSARPLFGPAGAAALAGIVAAQRRGADRFARMVAFFDTVGTGQAAGYGSDGSARFGKKEQRFPEPRAKADPGIGIGS